MTRARTVVTAALATAVVAGCGGGGDGLEKAELADRASAICKRYAERMQKLPNPPVSEPAKAGEYFQAAHDLAQEQQDELEALEPAGAVRDDYERLLDVSQEAADLLAEIGDAVGDQERVADLAQDLPTAVEGVNEAATEVGAKECAAP